MAIIRLDRMKSQRPGSAAWLIAALAGCLCAPASALDFDPRVTLAAIYSDNIGLAAVDPQDDVVLSASPGIGIFHYGQRVTLEADYAYQWFRYRDASDTSSSFGVGDVFLGLELVPDVFFWDSFASQTQTYKDPLVAIPNTNADLTSNRADIMTLSTTPRLILPIYSAIFDTQWTVGLFDYDDPDLQDADYVSGISTFQSEPDVPGIFWAIDHSYTRFEYDLPPVAKRQELTLELGYNLANFSVFARGGKESPFNDPTDDSLTDNIWIGGVRYSGARTAIEAYAGDRSFGSTYGASLTRNINRGLLAFRYDELPFRSEQIFDARGRRSVAAFTPVDPLIPEAPDRVTDINAPGRGSIFVRKQATANFSKYTNRNNFALLVFWERRVDEILQDGTEAPGETSTTGFQFNWTYNVGRRTTTGAVFNFTDRTLDEPGNKRGDEFTRAQVFLGRQLGNTVNARIYYEFRERDGDISMAANFKANEVGITFTAECGQPAQRPVDARNRGR